MTVRLTEELAEALQRESRESGVARGEICAAGDCRPVAEDPIRLGDGAAFRCGPRARRPQHQQGLSSRLDQKARMTHILDAVPLIAALNRNDNHHRWALDTISRLGPPFHSCPEAMAEAAAMTGRPAAIVEMIHAGEIVLSFDLTTQTAAALALLKKDAHREMDLADACIVRMSELVRDCRVVTLRLRGLCRLSP